HTVGRVPWQRIDEDVAWAMSPGKNAGKQNAIVVSVRLVAEDRHRECIAPAAREDVFDKPGASHAVADNHQPLLGVHGGSCLSKRAAQTLNSGILLVGSSAGFVRRLTDSSPLQ